MVNLSKCVTLKCYRSLHVSHTYCMTILLMHELENMKEHSYLGITIAQSMLFIPHINDVTCKATKVLNFIECNLYK